MPKLGDALKKAVEVKPKEEPPAASREKPSSPLMNSNRRAIFQYLCLHPCSGVGEISTGLSLSRSSVSWHLQALEKAGYIESFIAGKTPGFCPKGMVSRHGMEIYYALSRDSCSRTYLSIVDEPGLDTAVLEKKTGTSRPKLSKCLDNMIELGIISSVRDGRHNRYFPTGHLSKVILEERKTHIEFIRLLVRRMSEEHLRPEVEDMKGRGIIIYISLQGQRFKIEVPTQPLDRLSIIQ